MIAIDTETTPINSSGKVRTKHEVPDLVCYTWYGGDKAEMTWSKGLSSWEDPHVLRTLLDSGDTLVFHNCAFDLAVLAKAYPDLKESLFDAIRKRRILDTKIMYHMRRPGVKCDRDLRNACLYVLGDGPTKEDATRLTFTREKPLTPEQDEYAREDAKWTYELAEALLSHPYGELDERPPFFTAAQIYSEKAGDFDADREFSAATAWQAFQCSAVGLGIDPERFEAYVEEYQGIESTQMALMIHLGLARLKRLPRVSVEKVPEIPDLPRTWTARPGDNCHLYRRTKSGTEQVQASPALIESRIREEYMLFAKSLNLSPTSPGGVPLDSQYPVTPTGNISLDAKFWKTHRDEMPPRVRTHHALCEARKFLSTYFRPLALAKRVYPSFLVAYAATGRWTCKAPNLQNQPKAIRDMYVSPEPGELLVSADYKSLEMYTACEAFHRLGLGNGPLRLVLDRGGDTHRNTAALMFDLPAEQIDDHQRFVAKTANFSLLGGLGARKFATQARKGGLEWTLTDAVYMRNLWFNAFTDARAFLELFHIDPWDLCPSEWNRRAWLDLNEVPSEPWPTRFELSKALNDGRLYEVRLPSGRLVRNRRFSQAANLFFQGIGAEVVTRAFNLCCDRGLKVCNVVHDSITITAPVDEADWAGGELVNAMKEAQQQICNCGVEIPLPEYTKGTHWS